MTAVELFGRFSSKLFLTRCPQLLPNDWQNCYETYWSVRLSYWDVHIVSNLFWGKYYTSDGCLNLGMFQKNGLKCCLQHLINDFQDCNEIQWSVRLSYLGKICISEGC